MDCSTQYFYWTDVSGKAISRAKLDGTDSNVLIQSKKNDSIACFFLLLRYFVIIKGVAVMAIQDEWLTLCLLSL